MDIEQLIIFLNRCIKGLRPNGYIGIKENVSISGIDYDEQDGGITR